MTPQGITWPVLTTFVYASALAPSSVIMKTVIKTSDWPRWAVSGRRWCGLTWRATSVGDGSCGAQRGWRQSQSRAAGWSMHPQDGGCSAPVGRRGRSGGATAAPLLDPHRRGRAERARLDDDAEQADRIRVGHLHRHVRALRE